jgi:hypothetical protein
MGAFFAQASVFAAGFAAYAGFSNLAAALGVLAAILVARVFWTAAKEPASPPAEE